jgi:hypothetical protein
MVEGTQPLVARNNSADQNPDKDISVDERRDEGEACFCVFGPGRGGDVIGGFAFPLPHDLLVLRSPEAAAEVPPEQRMRKPVAAIGEFPGTVREAGEIDRGPMPLNKRTRDRVSERLSL